MKSPIRYTLLSSALLFSLQAAADEAATTLDRVQVTGSRVALGADRTLSSVTVLDRAAIEASRSVDVADLLAKQTGIDLVRTGGSGAQNTVFVRGGNSNHVLVLIDGIRVNSATQGLFDFAHLPLAMIERIEIVRGPRAAVWGADALAGVIQVFTRVPEAFNAELRAGSYGRHGLDAGIGFGDGDRRFGLSAGFDAVEGFSATNPANLWNYDPDKDGYRNQHVAVQARTGLGTQTLSFGGIATQGEIEFDQGRTFADNHSWSAGAAGMLHDAWSHELTVGQAYEKLDTPDYSSVYGSRRSSVDWTHSIRLDGKGLLALGLNWADEDGYSNGWAGNEFDRSRRNRGLFALWNGDSGRQGLELAARFDDNSQYGGHLTGSAAWSLAFGANSRLRASWGQGFRAPNFNELYYPGFFGSFAGNPDLDPETSHTAEIGLETRFGAGIDARFSAYRSDIGDLISFAGAANQAINIANARIEGAEAELLGEAGAWQWRAQATWTDAVNADTGAALLRRPKIKGLLELQYAFGNGARLGAELSAVGSRPDFGTVLPGYGRFDLTASWPVTGAWRLEGRLENVLDRDYQLVDGYNTPGRSLFLRLAYQGR